ncbi:MAG: hypothetical protein OHM56_06330 [Spiroplasma phoeniceum]|nr:MAG: hypothetical protein OHM57_05745 [Spiroplasma phoeniceum]UZQ33521.1 MAG: hypothetical protein OHM56_06330 [Spiroplasma phoeniceum]
MGYARSLINIEIKPNRRNYCFFIWAFCFNIYFNSWQEIKKGCLVESLKEIDENLIKHFDYLHPSINTAKQKKNVPIIKKLNLPLSLWTFKNNKDIKVFNNLYDKTFIHGYISDSATLNPNLK